MCLKKLKTIFDVVLLPKCTIFTWNHNVKFFFKGLGFFHQDSIGNSEFVDNRHNSFALIETKRKQTGKQQNCEIERYKLGYSLGKIFLKFLHAGDYFHLLHKSAPNHKFSNKNNYLPAWRDFKMNFSRPKMVFFVTDSILWVKPMYESVK